MSARHLFVLAPALLAGLLPACTAPTGDTTVTRAAPQAETAETEQPMQTDANGTCWASEIVPAVYEQVPGQVQVVQAQTDANGTVTQPAIYRNATVPKLVTPRGEFRFEAPCPAQMTPDFIATLQRALYARGYLRGAITGRMDPATREAVDRYQRERGLKSAQLALSTARDLGLVIVPLAQ